jgi:tetratricopeptide (TPR) repeat protein
MRAEMQWRSIANKSMLGQTEKMLPQYESLYNQLRKNRLFLYNYAAELTVAGKYSESLKIAFECEKLWADYDLQMLIAENYLQCEQYEQAENHYGKASLMCPVKFTPLYRLYQLSGTTGDLENESVIANKILSKPVKIMSSAIQTIKEEIRQKMDE